MMTPQHFNEVWNDHEAKIEAERINNLWANRVKIENYLNSQRLAEYQSRRADLEESQCNDVYPVIGFR